MAADNGGHIDFVGQEKHVGHDIDSVYDEEEIIKTKESDFKHKQVCAFGDAGIYFDDCG